MMGMKKSAVLLLLGLLALSCSGCSRTKGRADGKEQETVRKEEGKGDVLSLNTGNVISETNEESGKNEESERILTDLKNKSENLDVWKEYRTMESYFEELPVPDTGSGYMESDCFFLPGCSKRLYDEFIAGIGSSGYMPCEPETGSANDSDGEGTAGLSETDETKESENLAGVWRKEDHLLQLVFVSNKNTLVMRLTSFEDGLPENTENFLNRGFARKDAEARIVKVFNETQAELRKSGEDEEDSPELIPIGVIEVYLPGLYENTSLRAFLLLYNKVNAFYFQPYLVSADGILEFNCGFTDAFTADADRDGIYEVYGTSGWGSGIYRNTLVTLIPEEGAASENGSISGTLRAATFVARDQVYDIRFLKTGDQEVHLVRASYRQGTLPEPVEDYGIITRTDEAMFDGFMTDDFPFDRWEDLSYAQNAGSDSAADTLKLWIGGDEIEAEPIRNEEGDWPQEIFAEYLNRNSDKIYDTNGVYENGPNRAALDFGGRLPDEITVKDYLLTETGEMKYNGKIDVMDREVLKPEEDGGLPSFGLSWHITDSLSSSMSAYTEPQCRGFVIKARWGEEEKEFCFAIRVKGIR